MFRVSYFATKVQKSQQIAKHSNKKIWLALFQTSQTPIYTSRLLHHGLEHLFELVLSPEGEECGVAITFGSECKHSLHSLNHDLFTIDDVDALHLATVILQVRRVIRQLATQEIVDTTLTTDGLQFTHLSIAHIRHITPLHVN